MSCEIFKDSCEDCPGAPKYICTEERGQLTLIHEHRRNERRLIIKVLFLVIKDLFVRFIRTFKKIEKSNNAINEEYKTLSSLITTYYREYDNSWYNRYICSIKGYNI